MSDPGPSGSPSPESRAGAPSAFPFAAAPPPPAQGASAPRQLSIADLKRKQQEEASLPLPPPVDPADVYTPSTSGGAPRSTAYDALPPPNAHLLPAHEVITVEQKQSVVTPLAIGAAAGAAVAGTVLWAVAILLLSVEVGWLALGIGAGIGFAAMYAGGRGFNMGMICAGLAFLAIFFGRFLGVVWAGDIQKFEVPMDRDTDFAVQTLAETGDLLAKSLVGESPAQEYARVQTRDQLAAFMYKYDYTTGGSADEVTEDEIASFRENIEPGLLAEIEAGRAPREQILMTMKKESPRSPLGIFWENFGPYDIAFFFFGMGLAFYIGGRKDADL